LIRAPGVQFSSRDQETAMIQIQPYLFFNGRCEEAIAFYQRTLGAQVEMLMRNKESPEPPPPGSEDKVMHATLKIGEAVMMASDGRCDGAPEFKGFSLSLAYPTTAECDKVFTSLADGGRVDMPLGKTFWSDAFGMVTDRFGVQWMVSLDH
jgi:PhnB protein